MKQRRVVGRSRSPELQQQQRVNKLSDHTSPPRRDSNNDPEANRRSSECLNFLSKSKSSGKRKDDSPIRSVGLLPKESRKAGDSTEQRMKCSTKAEDIGKSNHSFKELKAAQRQKPASRKNNKYDQEIRLLEKRIEELKRMSLNAEQPPEQKRSRPKKRQKAVPKLTEKRSRQLPKKEKKMHRSSKHIAKDFVLVGHEILTIENSEQLEELLKKRKDEESQDPPSSMSCTHRPSEVIEKYLLGLLDIADYQREVKEKQNELDVVMFHVKDLNGQEKADLYHRLKQDQIVPEPETPPIRPAAENRFEVVLRSAIDTVERKFHVAKLLLDKLEVDPMGKRYAYDEKLAKLIQWKNKKFRELMTAKTFIELNSSRQKLEEEHFSDPMKALSAMFQREFEQLINEQYFFPLNRRKPEELVQLHSVQQKLREEEQQERDAFALESKGSVPQQLIEEIKRAKQIKDVINSTIESRLLTQQSQSESAMEDPSHGIVTNLTAVNFYLVRLIDFILERHEREFLLNIKKCYGLNILSKLRMVHSCSRTNTLTAESTFNEVLSSGMFVEFEQSVIVSALVTKGNGHDERQRQIKLYEHIHNKAVYDAFNFFLNTFRPFYREGQPLPWKANSQFISSFIITEENEHAVLENARFSVLTLLESLCGTIVGDLPPEQLPQDMTSNERAYCQQILQESLENVNADRGRTLVNQEVLEYLKADSTDLFETLVMCELADELFAGLVQQALTDIF